MPVNRIHSLKPVFVYTMTVGLGDVVVLNSLASSIEDIIPDSICQIFHRGNPHTKLWSQYCSTERYTEIYRIQELFQGISRLRRYRAEGRTVFGLQMAPGSLQGFFFFTVLKKLGALDFVVDFNLINADIITPPRGSYILDMHLNQIADITGIDIPSELHNLRLPSGLLTPGRNKKRNSKTIGIHPWSRRGHLKSFVWQDEKWLELVRSMLNREDVEKVIIFGKDKHFEKFTLWLKNELSDNTDKLQLMPSSSVTELISTISSLDLLISVNTAVVHIGYAIGTPMVVLCGPSLDLWVPKGKFIKEIRDEDALFQASDKWINDSRFGSIQRIKLEKVIEACQELVITQ